MVPSRRALASFLSLPLLLLVGCGNAATGGAGAPSCETSPALDVGTQNVTPRAHDEGESCAAPSDCNARSCTCENGKHFDSLRFCSNGTCRAEERCSDFCSSEGGVTRVGPPTDESTSTPCSGASDGPARKSPAEAPSTDGANPGAGPAVGGNSGGADKRLGEKKFGETCMSDGECVSRSCDGFCTRPCADASQCPSGFVCSIPSGSLSGVCGKQ